VSNDSFDVIVIGGGPGGSSIGSYLAKAGKKVLLLEKEVFPRFHIGESLLPYNTRIFQELGLMPALLAAGFPRKFGAQFGLGDNSKWVGFVFRNGKYTRETEAFQVERARFDHILLNQTQTLGVDVRQGWTALRYEADEQGITVHATGPENRPCAFRASYLADASGRGNLTGNQDGARIPHANLNKIAVFGHFENVKLDPGERGGDTVIVRLERHWFWIIPVSAYKTSVGCVFDKNDILASKTSPEALFDKIVALTPALQQRMASAKRVGPIYTTADFSYYNKRLVGSRLVRVGDAAGFLDPIFSSGVYMAMLSGKLGAEAILAAFNGASARRVFGRYEKKLFSALKFYWEMIEGFYTTPFMEVFMEPREKWNLPAAVNAALAGELNGDWSLRWRMRVFFWLVKLQAKRPFLPKIFFPATLPNA
jgi:flavin-dependent dehydrogenase